MKLFFREYGEGKPIIIAHGLFGMSDNWIPVAKQLSEKFKVYLLDMRNHGQSPHSDIHTYVAISKDLAEFIKDKKIKKASFIGHSMGGKAVMQFAVDYPEKVEQMIILDISPKEYQFNDTALGEGITHLKLFEIFLDVDIKEMKNRKEISEYFNKYFSDDFILQLIQKNITKNKQKQFAWKINVDVLNNNLNEIGKEIHFLDYEQFVKILFVFGNNSPYFRNEDKIYIKDNLPNAVIKVIKDAEHFLHINNEKELIETISAFLL